MRAVDFKGCLFELLQFFELCEVQWLLRLILNVNKSVDECLEFDLRVVGADVGTPDDLGVLSGGLVVVQDACCRGELGTWAHSCVAAAERRMDSELRGFQHSVDVHVAALFLEIGHHIRCRQDTVHKVS